MRKHSRNVVSLGGKLRRTVARACRLAIHSGKLLSSVLLTLSHTYPLENKFVNPEEWASEGWSFQIFNRLLIIHVHLIEFRKNHHHYWGKLYAPGDVKVRLITASCFPN